MQGSTKQTLKFYWQASRKYKISGVLALLSTIISAAVGVIIPIYYKNLFNILTSGRATDIIMSGLFSVLFIIIGLKFLEWLFYRIGDFLIANFQVNNMADLSNKCFTYLHKHSFSYFNNNFGGALVKKVKWFTNAFEVITDTLFFNLIPIIVDVAIILFVLSNVNIYLGLGILVWLFLFLAVNWIFVKFKFKYDIQRNEAETFTTGLLADTITNHSNVKLFNGYKRETENYAKAVEKLRRIRKFTWNLSNIFNLLQGLLMVFLEIGTLYLAIKLWQKNSLTVGDFVLIQGYLGTIFMNFWNIGRVVRNIYERLSDAEEMTVILSTPHEIKDAPKAQELNVGRGRIEFKDVCFNYHKTREIFKKFNLTIESGEKAAFVGSSGAGKTTIVKLLLRMHDLAGGKILINGQNIARVKQESLWRNISLVPQDPILFHRTLMENIRYGQPEATDEEVYAAAKAAHCHEFIINTPEGYNTYVGERGIKLSGGERQRIAIARAILRNAPILILDEATSSLDSKSEVLIQDALDKLMKGKTVIVIAHRLSTIRKMDRIMVIKRGQIIEEGTHEELASRAGGIYQKFWQLQAGGFIK